MAYNNLIERHGLSDIERIQLQRDIIELRPYILALKKKEMGKLKCERCGQKDTEYHIHHKRVAMDVNYYDLELLCWACHKKEHPIGIFKPKGV